MTKILRIGIVGCGAIGTSLAKIIIKDLSGRARVAAVYDSNGRRAMTVARDIVGNSRCVAAGLGELISASELVIEAASAQSSYDIALRVLSSGKDIVIMSVGGVVEQILMF